VEEKYVVLLFTVTPSVILSGCLAIMKEHVAIDLFRLEQIGNCQLEGYVTNMKAVDA